MESAQRAAQLVTVAILATTICASAEVRKEFRFTVGPRAAVSVTNQYGPISVKPGSGNQVVVTAILHSDRAEIDQSQSGNRVDIVSHLFFEATADTGRIDYEVTVPADASVTLRSSTGPLQAAGLHGDVVLEGSQANIDVRDISDAHVHVKTLNGSVTLSNIRNGHVEITSVGGDVTLNRVSGPQVQVNSTSGKIRYEGDFGNSGEYTLPVTAETLRPALPTTPRSM